MIREVAWRLFAGEYNASNLEMGGGERTPSYVVTPLGARANRLYLVGVLTDVENVGTEPQPMWRARVSDPTGTFHVYAGQYQPEAAGKLSGIKPPAFTAIVGKSRTYSPEQGTVYTSVRPELVKVVDAAARDYWILEACRSLRGRIEAAREAYGMDPLTKDALVALGRSEGGAEGIVAAVGHYGKVDLSRYTSLLAESLRYLLPEFRGFTEVEPPKAAEPEAPKKEETSDLDDTVLALIAELDRDGKGAPWDAILDRAGKAGIQKDALEEAVNELLDKGLVYEPVLGRMKKI